MAEDYGATGGGKYAGFNAPSPYQNLQRVSNVSLQPAIGRNPNQEAPRIPATMNTDAQITPVGQQNYYQPNVYQGATGGGGGGYEQQAAASVPDVPKPVMPDYNSWSEDQVAAGDSAFMDQRGMYQNKLQKYIADYEAQAGNNAYGQDYGGADFLSKWSGGNGGGRMGGDYRMASQGVERNRGMGLTNVAEDFASRGMANSGLYADSFQKAIEGYNRQKQGLDSATTGGVQDLSFKRGNFEGDTQAGVQSARRDAIGRLMQNFNLGG